MKAYRRVLVATDFSPASRATIGAVQAIAGKGDLQVRVLYVVEPLNHILPETNAYQRARRARVCTELARFCADLEKRVGGGVRARPHVATGSPAMAICRVAESIRAQLVIVGSHGRTGYRRAMIGSVAERVARLAQRPVLIVPGAGAHSRRR
ncbi:MAG: universal stress protein [Candidatus Binatia bacterium]